jgi:hypothetical protein
MAAAPSESPVAYLSSVSLPQNIKSHNEDRVFINTRLNGELLAAAESGAANDASCLRSASQRQVGLQSLGHVAALERVSAWRRSRASGDVETSDDWQVASTDTRATPVPPGALIIFSTRSPHVSHTCLPIGLRGSFDEP